MMVYLYYPVFRVGAGYGAFGVRQSRLDHGFAALLLALITLLTNYTCLPITPMSTYRSKQEFLASLPPWRRP
jgi:hypothetical protein